MANVGAVCETAIPCLVHLSLLDIEIEDNQQEASPSIQEESTASDEAMHDITERSEVSVTPGPPPSIEVTLSPSIEVTLSPSIEVTPDQTSSSNAQLAVLSV